MAVLTFSPLITGISGKAGHAVFATWKGRPYVRQLVTPANPKSALQTAQRNAMAECVAMWHLMLAALKVGYANGAAEGSISGYNDWCKRNVIAVKDETGLIGPRRNTKAAGDYIEIPTGFAYDSEPAAGQMKFIWTDPAQGADYHFGHLVYDATDNVILAQNVDTAVLSLEASTIAECTIGNDYLVAFWVYRVSDEEFVHFGTAAHEQAT